MNMFLAKQEQDPVPLHAQALATVSFEGLGLFCINDRKECEIGALQSANHLVVLRIRQKEPTAREFAPLPDFGEFVKIEITDPDKNEVTRYFNNADPPVRNSDKGDPKDFRWLIDLESDLYHNKQITVGPEGRDRLHPVFFIASGSMYTLAKADGEDFSARVRWDDEAARRLAQGKPAPGDSRLVGNVGQRLGIDLLTKNPSGSKVILSSVDRNGQPISGGATLELPGGPGVKYEISIRNLCPAEQDCPEINDNVEETDFRSYYEIISDPQGLKFDFKRVRAIKSLNGPIVIPIEEDPNLGLDGCPLACHAACLSLTNTLG
jgi:hypothetical protein